MLTTTRKWTVELSVGGQSIPVAYGNSDTLRAVVLAAKDAAYNAIFREEIGSDASLVVFKQLKGDAEPVRDRSFYGFRDWNGSGTAVVVWQ
jgi:hypothetical protein